MKILSNQGVLPKGLCEQLSFCEHCIIGKVTRQAFTKAEHTTKGILNYIYSNLWGPTQTHSLNGSRYFISFIDDLFRKCWVYFLKTKNKALTKFKE